MKMSTKLQLHLKLFLISISLAAIIAGCTTTKKLENINRSEVPQVNGSVPASASEIREIKFYKEGSETAHKSLHLAGQVFSKSSVGGTTQITPCGNCIVRLTTPTDSSLKINITTAADGYFTYHGKNLPFILTLENAGHNRMEIGPVEFYSDGATVIKIVNAAGSGSERFTVIRNEKNYTWQ